MAVNFCCMPSAMRARCKETAYVAQEVAAVQEIHEPATFSFSLFFFLCNADWLQKGAV